MSFQKPSGSGHGRSRRGTREAPLAVSDRIAKSLSVCRETELKSKNIKVRPPKQEAPPPRRATSRREEEEVEGEEGPFEVRYVAHRPGRRRGRAGAGRGGREAPAGAAQEPEKKRTSVRLPLFMWDALDDICYRERLTLDDISQLIGERIEWKVQDRESRCAGNRGEDGNQTLATSLSTAIRIFILAYYRALAEEMDRLAPGYQAIGERRNVAKEPETDPDA